MASGAVAAATCHCRTEFNERNKHVSQYVSDWAKSFCPFQVGVQVAGRTLIKVRSAEQLESRLAPYKVECAIVVVLC